MTKLCDLHTHSVFSDGTDTPAELISLAVETGLSAVALCDHNTVDGLPDFLAAAENKPIDAIAGAEFSVDYQGTELHLLGLFLPQSAFCQISALMTAYLRRKEESNIALVEALGRAGYSLDYETIKASSPNSKISRVHIAAELTRLGYTPSIKDAFRSLLSPKAGYYREPERPTVWEMLDFIRSVGALPVLAHPFLNLSLPQLEEFLPRAKDQGLAGMECFYPKFDAKATQDALQLAQRFHLLPSGGSDYHGANKPDTYLGQAGISYAWVEDLRQTISHRGCGDTIF